MHMFSRRTIFLSLALLAAAALTRMVVRALDSPDESAEFYFTRLAYSENGERGWGRPLPPGFRCPEFGGGRYFPEQGLGWSMDNPGADCKFMGGVHRLTNLRV